MNTVPTHHVEEDNALIWGNLKDFHVPDLLVYLHWARKTGILYITRERVKKHIYIRDGVPLAARSNMKSELMGEFLVSKEIITMEQQQRVLELQKSANLTFGDILLQQAMISKKDLFVQARRQFLSILFSLFGLNEGFYKFKEEDFPTGLYSFKVTFSNLLVFGIRQISDPRVIKEMMGSTSHIPVPSERFSDHRKIMFVDKELSVINEIDGSKTIQDIITKSSEQPITCMKTLLILLHHGLIQVKVDFRDEEINQIVDLEQSAAASLGFDSYQSEDTDEETAVAGNDFLHSPDGNSVSEPKHESSWHVRETSEPDQAEPVEKLSAEEDDLIQNVFKPYDTRIQDPEVEEKTVLQDETSERSDSESEDDLAESETPVFQKHSWTEEEIEPVEVHEGSPESASTELIEEKPSPLEAVLSEVPSLKQGESDLSEPPVPVEPAEIEEPSPEVLSSAYLEEEVRSAAETAWPEDVPGVEKEAEEAKTEEDVSVFTSGEVLDPSPQTEDELAGDATLSDQESIDNQEQRLAEETDSEIMDLEGGDIDTAFPSQEDEDQEEAETSVHESASSLQETTMNIDSIMQEKSEEEEGPFARAYKMRIESEKIEAEEEEVDPQEENPEDLELTTHELSETEEEEDIHDTETPATEPLESVLKNAEPMSVFETPAEAVHEIETENHELPQQSQEADVPDHPVLEIFSKEKEKRDKQESETAAFIRPKKKKRRFGLGYAAGLILVIGYGLFSLSPWKSNVQDRLFNTHGTEPVQLAQNVQETTGIPEKVNTAKPESVSPQSIPEDPASSVRQEGAALVESAVPLTPAPADTVEETAAAVATEMTTAAVPEGTVTTEPVEEAAPVETAAVIPGEQETAATTASNVVAQTLPAETSKPLPQETSAPVPVNADAQTKPSETAEVLPQVHVPQDAAVPTASEPIALAEPSETVGVQPDVSQPSVTVAQTPGDSSKAQMAQWTERLQNIPSTKYTIQVEISSRLTNVRNDWKRLEGYDAMVVGFKIKDWSAYTLLVGVFDSRQEGNEAVKDLPAYFLKQGPLVKTMNTIHKGLVPVE